MHIVSTVVNTSAVCLTVCVCVWSSVMLPPSKLSQKAKDAVLSPRGQNSLALTSNVVASTSRLVDRKVVFSDNGYVLPELILRGLLLLSISVSSLVRFMGAQLVEVIF